MALNRSTSCSTIFAGALSLKFGLSSLLLSFSRPDSSFPISFCSLAHSASLSIRPASG